MYYLACLFAAAFAACLMLFVGGAGDVMAVIFLGLVAAVMKGN